MKIAAMAAGAVGAYFGGRMQAAGHDVAYVARRAHLDALRKDGLKIESVHGDLHLPKVNATPDPKEVGPVDVVLFAVKLWDTETAAELAKPLVGPNTRVITLQNGVDSYERVSAILGKEQTCPGTAYIAAVLGGPGVMRHTSKFATMRVGRMDGKPDARLAAFVEAAKAANIDIQPQDDMNRERWQKFIFLSSMAGVNCMMREPIGKVLADPDTRAFYKQADGGVPRGRPEVRRQGAVQLGRRPHDVLRQRPARHEGLDAARPRSRQPPGTGLAHWQDRRARQGAWRADAGQRRGLCRGQAAQDGKAGINTSPRSFRRAHSPLHVMPGLVPGIHVLLGTTLPDVDGRDIGERSDAVLRTAKPGHDELRRSAPDRARDRSRFTGWRPRM